MDKSQVMEDPLVSVIIPTHNRPESLVETLKSVFAQTFQDFEIVLVNDAGIPVEEVIQPFLESGKLTYIRNSKNKRLPGTRNIAIHNARGKYIAYLDDDDIFYPNHLEVLVNALEHSDSRIAYTDSNCRLFQNENGKDETVLVQPSYGYDFSKDLFLVSNYIPVLCIMHEKSCFDEVGYFDENLSSHEDWELWIRMSRHNDFLHIKEITCEYVLSFEPDKMAKRQDEMLKTMIDIYERTEELISDRPDIIERRKNLILDSENRFKYHTARSKQTNKTVPEEYILLGVNLYSSEVENVDILKRINRIKGYISQKKLNLVRRIISNEDFFSPFRDQMLDALNKMESF